LADDKNERGPLSPIVNIVGVVAGISTIIGLFITIFLPSNSTNVTSIISNTSPPIDHSPVLEVSNAIASPPMEWRPPFWGLLPFVPSSWSYVLYLDINKLSDSPMSDCIGELHTMNGYIELEHVLGTSSEAQPPHGATFQLAKGVRAQNMWVGVVGEPRRIDMHNSTVRIKCTEYVTPWRAVDTTGYDRWYAASHPEWQPF
jgi:hypothetical protein